MIPLVLHQTWKTHEVPAPAEALRQGWRRHNPEFAYRFYDDAACRAVVAEAFGHWLDHYDRLPFGVMRADVFRYAVIFRQGGVYADIDMECLKPIAPLLRGRRGVLSVEAHLGRTRQQELGYPLPVQIANCVFAAEPGHPFFADAVARCFARKDGGAGATLDDVEDVTGPRMLTRLLFSGRYADLTVLPQILMMAPLDYPDRWPINANIHARHRTFGAWKNGSRPTAWRRFIERNRLPNPFARTPLDLALR
jgi:mannosyltransferase OCH1-like enzyme